jgi:hypothetical protein
MVEWTPISEHQLRDRIAQGESRMSESDRHLWNAIRIEPEKWQQHPYGDNGNGFWVVALIGKTIVWYNDIENGFNRSRFIDYGTIDEYWCNDDELDTTVAYLRSSIEHGQDILQLVEGVSNVKFSNR